MLLVSNQNCARICARDAAGWAATRETPRSGLQAPRPLTEVSAGGQRPCETPETCVVWLITQMSTAREYWLWHSFREVPSVSDGALIAAFVIMLAVPS